MRLVITRDFDGETFELVTGAWGNFVVHPDTVIPGSAPLDFVGYEYSGLDGGYNIASRLQRRPFDLVMTIAERWDNPEGLFELFAKARAFFDIHNDDLTVVTFTVDFYTCDKANSVFRLRNGSITVPLKMQAERAESHGMAQVSFIFADPYIYWSGDSGAGITEFDLIPRIAGQHVLMGRYWDTNAMWTNEGLKIWEYPADGDIPGFPVTVSVLSAQTVNAELTLFGRLVNPILTNITNGSQFYYYGTISDGETVIVTTDGILTSDQAATSPWSGTLTAKPGNNTYVLDAQTGSTGTVRVNIRGAL